MKKTFDSSTMIIELENEELKVLILPDMGGKILQIIHKPSGTQFLKEASANLQKHPKPIAGDSFLPPYASGFDDCFPTISPTAYQFKDQLLQLPDHGELWSQSWDYKHNDDGIVLWTTGEKIDYRFAKYIQLNGAAIELVYELDNLEPVGFDYLWSAHPLLNVAAGDRLILPDEISEVVLHWSSDNSLGAKGDRLEWPHVNQSNKDINFEFVQREKAGMAAKLFTDRLTEGKVGIHKQDSDTKLIFTFDTDQIPFLGIWLCYGGWPNSVGKKDFTVGLEPCSAPVDSLQEACEKGYQRRIASQRKKSWQLQLAVTDDG